MKPGIGKEDLDPARSCRVHGKRCIKIFLNFFKCLDHNFNFGVHITSGISILIYCNPQSEFCNRYTILSAIRRNPAFRASSGITTSDHFGQRRSRSARLSSPVRCCLRQSGIQPAGCGPPQLGAARFFADPVHGNVFSGLKPLLRPTHTLLPHGFPCGIRGLDPDPDR